LGAASFQMEVGTQGKLTQAQELKGDVEKKKPGKKGLLELHTTLYQEQKKREGEKHISYIKKKGLHENAGTSA